MHDDIGPPATAARFLDELQTEVEVWWRTKLALGQGNMTGAALRARLIG